MASLKDRTGYGDSFRVRMTSNFCLSSLTWWVGSALSRRRQFVQSSKAR